MRAVFPAAEISKLEAIGGYEGGPTRADLVEIMQKEFQHFQFLSEAITKLGGDPTVVGAGGTAGGGTSPVQSSGGLPFTGLDLSLIAAGALGLILLGAALRRAARQRA